jgi:alpha-ribazole phosphatase
VARILAVRHAAPARAGICYGRLDIEVVASAEAAATAILGDLARHGVPVGTIWSSPRQRCCEPATLVAAALGLPLHVDARLAELDFGSWEGLAWHEIEQRDALGFARFMAAWWQEAPTGGESWPELVTRVEAWLVERRTEVGVPLVVAHSGSIRALRQLLLGVSVEQAFGLAVPHLVIEALPSPPRPNR